MAAIRLGAAEEHPDPRPISSGFPVLDDHTNLSDTGLPMSCTNVGHRLCLKGPKIMKKIIILVIADESS